MKRSIKIITTLCVLVAMLLSMALIGVSAAADVNIYLTPNSNWKSDNARFAMYVWDDCKDYKWINMSDSNGDGTYEGVLPSGYTNIIFCRLTPSDSHNGWSTTWNQTSDLKYDGKNNHYTIASGAWTKGEGSWSEIDDSGCAHTYDENDVCTKCGEEHAYIIAGYIFKDGDNYKDGDNSTLFGTKWDVTDENNKMEYDHEAGCYVKVYYNVAAGEYAFKVAENKSWDVSYGKDGGNCYLKVDEDGSTVTIALKEGHVTSAVTPPREPGNNVESEKNEETDEPSAPNDSDKLTDTEKPDNSDGSQNGGGAEQTRPGFFGRIWQAIVNFFRNLFGKKK